MLSGCLHSPGASGLPRQHSEKASGVLRIHGKKVKPQGRSYYREEGRAADVPVLDQQSS